MPNIAINGRQIAFTDAGHGEPVILLHSGCSSRRQWRNLVSQLSGRYRVLAPDFYGHGESGSWTGSDTPSLKDYCEIVANLTAEATGSLRVVGHSHGGAVALAYAEAQPRRVKSLVLIEPTMIHLLRLAGPPEAWREVFELGQTHIDHVAKGKLQAVADLFVPYWIGHAAWSSMPAERREPIIATMPAVAQFWASTSFADTPLGRYEQILAPTLLVCGGQTTRPVREITLLLERLLPNAKLATITGAGHMSPMSHVDEVNAAIIAHLEAALAETNRDNGSVTPATA